jgi:hypothetical protein
MEFFSVLFYKKVLVDKEFSRIIWTILKRKLMDNVYFDFGNSNFYSITFKSIKS